MYHNGHRTHKRRNDESKAFYDGFAEKVSAELKAPTMIRQIRLEDILECDALSDFDENLLSWMIAKIEDSIPRSICVDFDRLMTAKQSEIRDLLQDKDVVYVYQNQIDQRGEGGRSENEVFNACEEAVKEIQTLIHRLTGYVSATRFLVTSDHGFIYKRDKLTESDKISIDKSDIPKTNYRYLLSDSEYQNDALISRSLAYLSALNRVYVTTPMGTDIIKKQAGGMNYVHGGSSLQEMIVPVVKVITAKGKQDTGYVNVEISSFISRITNTEFKLDFMQMTPVTDKDKPRKLVTGNGRTDMGVLVY